MACVIDISGQREFAISADILAQLPSDDMVICINRADNEQYPSQDPSLINGMTCINNLYCHSLHIHYLLILQAQAQSLQQ